MEAFNIDNHKYADSIQQVNKKPVEKYKILPLIPDSYTHQNTQKIILKLNKNYNCYLGTKIEPKKPFINPDIDDAKKREEPPHPAERFQDPLWEDNPYLDAIRYHIYETTGAYSLIDDAPYRINPANISDSEYDNLPFNYRELQKLNIQNLTLSTNKKGVRASSIFAKNNKKFMPLLKDYGINTIIDLRAESNIERSAQFAGSKGLDYVFFPIHYDQKLTPEQIDSMKASMPNFFDAMDKGSFYIGCNEGTNRTDVAFGINYLFNPNEKVVPKFESKTPQKSIQMTRRIVNDFLKQDIDGAYINIDDNFVKNLGWSDLDTFISELGNRLKKLNLSNLK